MIQNWNLMQVQSYLQFTTGPSLQQIIPLNSQEMWIGSDSQCHIFISDLSVSPWHARLMRDNASFLIQPFQNSFVEVNGQRITRATRITHGDEITLGIGGTRVRLHTNDVPQEPFPTLDKALNNPLDTNNDTARLRSVETGYLGNSEQSTSRPLKSITTSQFRIASPLLQKQKPVATEITRHLCAAAYFHESFRAHVLRHIVEDEQRAQGNAYGIDIIPIVKWCFKAQQRTFIRDIFLSVLSILILVQSFMIFGNIASMLQHLLAAPATDVMHPAQASFTTGLLIFLAPFVHSIFFLPALILSYLSILALIVLAVRFFVPSISRRTVFLIASLLFFSMTILPFYLLAWMTITIEKVCAYYGTAAKQLKRDNFLPDGPQVPLSPALQQRLRERLNLQEGNVVIYSGHSPFTGAGKRIGGWSFVVDVMRNSDRMPGVDIPSLQVGEMYGFIADKIKALRLPGSSEVSIKDELYVDGRRLHSNWRFVDRANGHLYTQVSGSMIKEYMENPTEDACYYQSIRLTSPGGEMVFTILLKFVLVEQKLFIEAHYLLLPPLAEEYRLVDILDTRSVLDTFLIIARQSFVPTLSLSFSAPKRLFSYLQTQYQFPARAVEGHSVSDYGADGSLRQFVSSSNDQSFSQQLNHEMHLKIIERQLLDSIISFLAAKHIDTRDVRERITTILNSNILVIDQNPSRKGPANRPRPPYRLPALFKHKKERAPAYGVSMNTTPLT